MENNIFFLISILTLLNFLLFPIILKVFVYFKFYDTPVKGLKLHKFNVPYAGGTIIYLNFLIIFFSTYNFLDIHFLISKKELINIFIFSSLIYFLGLIDDIVKLNSNLRLITVSIFIFVFLFFNNEYLISQILLSFHETKIEVGRYSIFLTTLCFLLFVQAFNMLDGINLQAGLYALFLFIFSVVISNNIFIFVTVPIVFFLFLNYKNRIFLGDSGTYLLSFLIGCIYIKMFNYNFLYTDEIFLIMSIPGYDMLRLFLSRLYKKKNPFIGDRNHIHHLFLEKFSEFNSIVFSILVIFSPIFLMKILNNNIVVFFITLFIYILIIFLLKKKK